MGYLSDTAELCKQLFQPNFQAVFIYPLCFQGRQEGEAGSNPEHEGGHQHGGLPPPALTAAKLGTTFHPQQNCMRPAVDTHSGLALLLLAEYLGKTHFAQSPWVTLGSILSPLGAAGKEELTPGTQQHH